MIGYQAYIGLGANLGQPIAQLQWAVQQLQQLAHSKLVAVSALYGSKPLGPANQPDYVNAAALVHTTLTPHQLLQALHTLENDAGRVRLERWGPRTLDLDILLYANDQISTAELTIPHRELCHRSFVVLPLLDISPALTLPNGIKLASLASATLSDAIHRLADHRWWL